MWAWIESYKNCSRLAFLPALPIPRVLQQSTSRSPRLQIRTDTELPSRFPRRSASFPPSQLCNHVIQALSKPDSNRPEVPVILLVDHGSRRAVANDMLSDVGSMLQQKTELSVYTAHMELASPTIAEGVDKCVREGATHIIVVPFFLSPGRHSTTDIPQLTADAVANHPGVTHDVRPPIGTHPGIIDVILDRAGLLGSVQN